MTRQAGDPSRTTDGSLEVPREGDGDAHQRIDAPLVTERDVRPGAHDASAHDASAHDASAHDASAHDASADGAPDDATRGMSRGASRGLSRTESEASAALAARNASFGMSDGTGGIGGIGVTGPALARVSSARFLHGRSWYFFLSVNILLAIVLSLTLVWVSIERMDINYFINLERANLREKQSLHGKLEVERERLLSPYELRVNAERLGMKAPERGQIRRMDLKMPIP